MSSEQMTPPPTEEQTINTPPITEEQAINIPSTAPKQSEEDALVVIEHPPHVHFSLTRWASSGVVRLLYRFWTRIAARLFPEDSRGEHVAQKLHIPLPDKLNMSWVNDHLAVGGRVRSEDIRALALSGVTHIVDTRSEYSDDKKALAQENIELLYLPTPDTYPLSLAQLMEGSTWINERIKQGGRVLIHCEHGVGRSVLLTCATLVAQGMHARDALELVQEKRWQASPNQKQIYRLKEFEAAMASRPDPEA